jgi:hypothetical protein
MRRERIGLSVGAASRAGRTNAVIICSLRQSVHKPGFTGLSEKSPAVASRALYGSISGDRFARDGAVGSKPVKGDPIRLL